jgi:hypothetical protein
VASTNSGTQGSDVMMSSRRCKSPKFKVNGKAGSYYAVASDGLPVTARVILAPPGEQCGDASFATCVFNRSGSTLKCK